MKKNKDSLILKKALPLCPVGRTFKENIKGGWFHSMTDEEAISGNFKEYLFTKEEMLRMNDWFGAECYYHHIGSFDIHEVTGKGTILAISLSKNDLELEDLNIGDIINTYNHSISVEEAISGNFKSSYDQSISKHKTYEIVTIEISQNSMGHNDNIGLVVKNVTIVGDIIFYNGMPRIMP